MTTSSTARLTGERQGDRDAARAAFILGEAEKLGIKVGTDGEELVVAIPLRLPTAVRAGFETAVAGCRDAIIDHILRENGERP